MKTMVTGNELRGRAIGAIFFAGFGAIWIGLALYAMERLTATNVSLTILVAGALVGMASWLLREAKHFPEVADDPAVGRAFGWINAIQWIAVAVVVVTFGRLHWEAYILCGITAVVGAHFYPLARLFRYRMHFVTGSALLVWAGLSALLAPVDRLRGVTALGTGVILWAAAATTLGLAARRAAVGGVRVSA